MMQIRLTRIDAIELELLIDICLLLLDVGGTVDRHDVVGVVVVMTTTGIKNELVDSTG